MAKETDIDWHTNKAEIWIIMKYFMIHFYEDSSKILDLLFFEIVEYGAVRKCSFRFRKFQKLITFGH